MEGMNMDFNKRLIDMTVGELLDVLNTQGKPTVVVDTENPDNTKVFGIQGIATLLGCSKTTAQRIKNSGVIDAAITQHGQLIITDANKAMELLHKNQTQY